MNRRNLFAFVLSLVFGTIAQSASAAGVVVLFSSGISTVPLSPWATAALGVIFAVSGLIVIRRKAGQGLFLLALTVVAAGGAFMQADESYAYASPTMISLVTSGASLTGTQVASMTGPFVCGEIRYVWVTSGAGTIRISGINYDPGYMALDPASPPSTPDINPLPAAPAPLCTVGMELTGSSSCVIWYQRQYSGC